MGVSSAVHWWEEWQLRILVLGSLFVQFLLFTSAALRKLAIPSWCRSIIWLAYLGSDALAIYALATLFTRQRKIDCSSMIRSQKDCILSKSNSVLEVVWAPVLLIHLGGRDLITAYNIEDNELWKRHVVTSVSQVAVAIYVFCRTWRGSDKRLLQAAILLFIPGVFKCIEKPVALMSASINSLVSSSGTALRTVSSLEEYVIEASSFVSSVPSEQPEAHGDGDAEAPRQGNLGFVSLVQLLKAKWTAIFLTWKRSFLQRLRAEWSGICLFWRGERSLLQQLTAWSTRRLQFRQCDGSLQQRPSDWWTTNLLALFQGDVVDSLPPQILRPSSLFVDLSSPYPERLSILKCFFILDGKGACDLLQRGLSNMFDLLYTKEYSSPFCSNPKEHPYQFLFGVLVRGVSMYLPLAAIVLFHYSHREDYNHGDVKITYALLYFTSILESYSIVAKQYVRLRNNSEKSFNTRLSAKVAQHSLMGLFACHKRHPHMMCLASSFKCKNYVDQHWCKKSCSSSGRITELVFEHVKGWWKDHIRDAASYRKFSNHRGQWTMNKCAGRWEELGWSLERPFDESVLIWHMATDLCFHFKGASNQHSCAADQCAQRNSDNDCPTWCQGSPRHKRAKLCTEMSNYLIYLLFVNPEMLLPGTRRNLFTTAYGELKERLKGEDILLQKRAVAQKIINKMQPPQVPQEGFIIEPEGPQEDFIQDAWKLTEALLRFSDEQMWEVIEGVWVEVLCFSASRCRGYLHAKSLGMGGELLTLVWLLLSHMGMETLSERLQMMDLELPRSTQNIVG